MTTPRGFRDKSDTGLLTLIGELPELVRNLVVAEVNAGKAWLAKAAKSGRNGAIFVVIALFVLFWSVPALGMFAIYGAVSLWGWPVWLGAIVVFGVMLVLVVVLALLAVASFRKIKTGNPVDAVAQDVRAVKEAGE